MPKKDDDLLRRLSRASAHLRDTGAPDLADAVDEMCAPTGWGKLRRAIEAASPLPRNVAVYMPREERDHLRQAAADRNLVLTEEAHEGLRRFLAGEFTPVNLGRGPYTGDTVLSNLNLRLDPDLRSRADAHGKQLKETGELDWTPKAVHVVRQYLLQRMPMPKTPARR
ncbi:hypothetical protein [Streptomyces sp. Ac-502]|uniref:hypothetical protein n=1 Tax=Streptomyces sp. Ac-502 TaxID=3342801 RepID=UPI00386283EA